MNKNEGNPFKTDTIAPVYVVVPGNKNYMEVTSQKELDLLKKTQEAEGKQIRTYSDRTLAGTDIASQNQ